MALAFHHGVETEAAPANVLWASRRGHLALVGPAAPLRQPVVSAQVYRRRRIVAACLAACCVLGLALSVAGWADRRLGPALDQPLAPAMSVGSWMIGDGGGLRYVVAEGDSLWDIVGRLPGNVSQRHAVEQLVRASGSARIVPGQIVEISG
jgi:hypothetical protein